MVYIYIEMRIHTEVYLHYIFHNGKYLMIIELNKITYADD